MSIRQWMTSQSTIRTRRKTTSRTADLFNNTAHFYFLPGRLAPISSIYSSMEVKALYPAQLIVPLGWRPRSWAWDQSAETLSKSTLTYTASQIRRFCPAGCWQPHRFALVEADGVAVWHRDETVPPLAALLQVLEQAPWEDGAAGQGIL